MAARIRNLTIPLVSCAIFISMMAVLGSRKVGVLEAPIRLTAGISDLIVVPVLLVLASRDWLANQRKNLPTWRDGLGGSSIVVLAAIWVLLHAAILSSSLTPEAARFISGIEWIGVFLLSSTLALALAADLRGQAHVYTASSAFLVFAGIQSTIYV